MTSREAPLSSRTVLDQLAAEERLLARYDRPARPLILESWEAQLLLELLEAVQQRRQGPADCSVSPPGGSRNHPPRHHLHGVPEDQTGPDRFIRRASLEPPEPDKHGPSGWFT